MKKNVWTDFGVEKFIGFRSPGYGPFAQKIMDSTGKHIFFHEFVKNRWTQSAFDKKKTHFSFLPVVLSVLPPFAL
jgi:hypothetical protein